MIAATIAGRRKNLPSLCKKAEKCGAEIIEIRFDKIIGEGDNRLLIEEIRKVTNLPIIATKRLSISEDAIKPIVSLVEYIDVEEKEDPLFIDYIKRHKKTLIISYHNYKNTPSLETLISLSFSMEKKGADIVKIATFIETKDDIIRLLGFTSSYKKPLIAIGMGSLGLITRVIAPMFGSLITYGFVNRPYADGQVSISFLKREIKRYFIDKDGNRAY